MTERPSGLAANAVWPSRATPRVREVIVNPGVTLTRDVGPPPTLARPLQREHPDVRSGLVDPDTGTVPPAPEPMLTPPPPTTEDVAPMPRTRAQSTTKGRAAKALASLKRKVKGKR